jgi:rubrerythrin
MERVQRCTVSARDFTDSEDEVEVEREEEVAAEDVANERLIKAIARMGEKEKMDIPVYEGNLDT